MALNSINTNTGALVALQNLNQTNRDLGVAQSRVNTGLKVSSAKDNGAIFAIASGQRAEMAALDSVKQSMQRGQSIVDVAMAAGDTVMTALNELKSLAVAIQDAPKAYAADGTTVTGMGESGKKLVADFEAIVKEIHTSLAGATFDGVNLFKAQAADLKVATGTGTGSTFTLKASGAAATAAAASFAFGSTQNTTAGDATFDQATGVWAAKTTSTSTAAPTAYTDYSVAEVEKAITAFTGTLADLGTKSKSLDRQLTFTAKMQDALETGVGNLVDADLAKESARLTALQTKQQLGVQALSIANQSSSIVLSLFR
ncbi:flagellin [Brevundimonas bullata]|uniref:Flagellin n=1 Tax=Brevundimonas bullata TaxID=13160 RepID=A0A7W7IPQ8_9CAUL|nr:flagellin [Brevundimonas bullata]MBB4798254.1 flagellin [Brevundimonas bullata]MBB6383432.1 flagellin [Brevundimonas bullata]